MYKILFKKSAVKELKKIPQKKQILIIKSIKSLALNPYPKGYKKLVGAKLTYRIRIGNYRVIYNLYDNELLIEIIRVKHRNDVYR
ncbi:MAG: type II toxin-antitoxin system RelE/ParE family toxin [Spirochaetia bacterium]|jgi:mRNA interferase RelE/StbE|nr:type II toxin-antitoxin system RelE/ParE family toxin [Spirochaetia bacterium]